MCSIYCCVLYSSGTFSYLTFEFFKSVMILNPEFISSFSRNYFNFKSNVLPRESFTKQNIYERCSREGYLLWHYPMGIYLLKVNNRNTRTRCEICSKLTIKTPERLLRRTPA